jgi:lipopolysaccharide biosynthesis protein
MLSLLADWRRVRRQLKDRMPYVRRRVFHALRRRYDSLSDAVHAHVIGAGEVRLQPRKPLPDGLQGEVCLFVTHAARRELKGHVLHHIEHLLRSGVQVALIVNTDLPLDEIAIDPRLAERLAGVYVRQNSGFDFGAWFHVLRHCDRTRWERLYLVNDSIVGPVDAAHFDEMIRRIRSSPADMLGLCESRQHMPHLQSFFLVFGAPVLASPLFARLVQGVIDFPHKEQVIVFYELRQTRSLREAGFRCDALYAVQAPSGVVADVHGCWDSLLEGGFPYVKTRVIQDAPGDPRIQAVRQRARVDSQI